MCGLVVKSMYGMRDAASNWELFSSEVLSKNGYENGKANPCLMYNPTTNSRALKHGDDFVISGKRHEPQQLLTNLRKGIALKSKGIIGPCPEKCDVQEAIILNRLACDGDDAHGPYI